MVLIGKLKLQLPISDHALATLEPYRIPRAIEALWEEDGDAT